MRRLVPCPQCKRHVFATETTCPHCGKSGGAATIAALAMSAGLALAACDPAPVAVYGPPPVSPSARQDVPTADPSASASASASSSLTPEPGPPMTAPVAVYGPPPVRPEDRMPQPVSPSPSATQSPSAAPSATAAPTAKPKPAPKK